MLEDGSEQLDFLGIQVGFRPKALNGVFKKENEVCLRCTGYLLDS
jgi:hypothetical protein